MSVFSILVSFVFGASDAWRYRETGTSGYGPVIYSFSSGYLDQLTSYHINIDHRRNVTRAKKHFMISEYPLLYAT